MSIPRERALGRKPDWTVVLLVSAAAVAWAVAVGRMRGMDAGPGTDLIGRRRDPEGRPQRHDKDEQASGAA